MPNTFGSPWDSSSVFSETHSKMMQDQMAVVYNCIYQKDNKMSLSMMTTHLALSCGTLSSHQLV